MHNYWNAASTYRLTMVDAATGATMGTMNQRIGANSTVTMSMQSIQSGMGLGTPSQNHVNLFFSDVSSGAPYVTVSHVETNNSLANATFNLTNACAVNAPATTSTGGGGFVGY